MEFVVQLDGRLTDFKILRSVEKTLDEEALRLLTESPAWLPGKQNGTVVKQKLVLPINFKLKNDDRPSETAKEVSGQMPGVYVVGDPK